MFKMVLLWIVVCGVAWGTSNNLPVANRSNIQLSSVESKYNAQRQILILKGTLDIPTPWHVYAHKLEQEYYVETGFRLKDTTLGEVVRSQFPEEEELKVAGEVLKVHSGSLKFSQWLYLNSAKTESKESIFPIDLEFRYQACSDKICLPPVSIPVTIQYSSKGNELISEW